MIGFYIKHGHKVLLGFTHGLLKISKLLVGCRTATIYVVAAYKKPCFTSLFDVLFVHRVGNAGTLGGFYIDKLNFGLIGHTLPVDTVLKTRNIYSLLRAGGQGE